MQITIPKNDGETITAIGPGTGEIVTIHRITKDQFRFGYNGTTHQTVRLDGQWATVTPDPGAKAVGGELPLEELLELL